MSKPCQPGEGCGRNTDCSRVSTGPGTETAITKSFFWRYLIFRQEQSNLPFQRGEKNRRPRSETVFENLRGHADHVACSQGYPTLVIFERYRQKIAQRRA